MQAPNCRFAAACHVQRGCDRRDIPIAARDAESADADLDARMPLHLH